MDIVKSKTGCNTDRTHLFICAALIAVTGLCITVGIKSADAHRILQDISLYGRYEGLPKGIISHITAAVDCSALCLCELLVMYLMSYSPLFVPTVLTITGVRGFISGIAYSGISGTLWAAQLGLHIGTTVLMCIFTAFLLKSENCGFLRKAAVLAVFSGICVIGEFATSYIT